MLEPGVEAPPFTLPDQHGERFSLADAAGGWLVLYFYPRAGTSGSRGSSRFSNRSAMGPMRKAVSA